MLLSYYQENLLEAGCDEAGRGCLAGPVYAAAVIFDKTFRHPLLTDSKQLTPAKRLAIRQEIEDSAVNFAVASVDPAEIDRINIYQASCLAMHRALDALTEKVEYILVDGNRFIPYREVPHTCVVKGDGKYLSIAAASILAKTYRDEYMEELCAQYPMYGWSQNKGYPIREHRYAILEHGPSPHHRVSFRVSHPQLELFAQEETS